MATNKKTEAATTVKKVSKEKLVSLAAKQVPEISKAEIDQTSKAAIMKKITEKKDLKYIYPADCTNLADRKKFRHSVRQSLKQYTKKLHQIKKGKIEGNLEKATKEFNTYRKSVLAGFKPEVVNLD